MVARRWTQWAAATAVLAALSPAPAQRAHYQIGGRGGAASWSALAQGALAVDDTSFAGSLQPKELRPGENVIVGPGRSVNLFGQTWQFSKTGGEAFGLQLGVNPRVWEGQNSAGNPEYLDGDTTTSTTLRQGVPAAELAQYATLTSSAWEQGIFDVITQVFTLDLAFEMPLNRISFFPPQKGIDRRGVPNRQDAPQAFLLSVQRAPEDFLIGAWEPYPMRVLDTVVRRTLTNSNSMVEITFPLQPVRFLRLDMSLMPQVFGLAEIQAFGEGVLPQVTWLSRAVDLGQPVNFGAVQYGYRVWRRDARGELAEDAQPAARLLLETRTGTDPTPLAYLVVDDFGGDREVTRAEYEKAEWPRRENTSIRYPGQKSGIQEDRRNWSTWSSAYERPGLQNRSPDGRQYLQLRATFQTEDPLSIGRLDSVVFEYSPLLAARVVGEVAPADPVPAAGGADLEGERPAEAPAGQAVEYTYDILASFDAPSQSGFDAVRLDVPAGTEFLGLQMGQPLAPVEPDSVRASRGELVVYFARHRVAAGGRPLRLALRAAVLNSSTYFTGDVVDTRSANLPQSINAGNVRDDVPTNSLQVFAAQKQLALLANVALQPPALTPNGDGANDRLRIAYTLMFVEAARVEVEILDLAGRRVRRLTAEGLGRGRHQVEWDGADDSGGTVAPGLYLCRVSARSQTETAAVIRPVPVAY